MKTSSADLETFTSPKMMPGQEPYTRDELESLYKLLDEAADGDPGELDEDSLKREISK